MRSVSTIPSSTRLWSTSFTDIDAGAVNELPRIVVRMYDVIVEKGHFGGNNFVPCREVSLSRR